MCDCPTECLDYLRKHYIYCRGSYPEINENVRKSNIFCQYLLHLYTNDFMPVDEIIKVNHDDIGLFGSGHSCFTKFCKHLCSNIICHTHSILNSESARKNPPKRDSNSRSLNLYVKCSTN